MLTTKKVHIATSPEKAATDSLPPAVTAAVEAIDARKGIEIEVLDLRGLNDATDFFVIATGTSDAHLRGLADAVLESLQQTGTMVHHVEGLPGGRWVLLDALDLVVHLFHPETREFYQLERLWQDAPRLLASTA